MYLNKEIKKDLLIGLTKLTEKVFKVNKKKKNDGAVRKELVDLSYKGRKIACKQL